jgi:TolA-binding protein
VAYAQYNEKDILFQQAAQMLAQRQYAQAEQLYIMVLDKYPNDIATITQLLQIYFALMQTDKAEALLSKYQRVIPAQVYSEQHIQLLVMQAKVSEAWQESLAYLALFNHEEYRYRQIASYFERKGFYDKVLELYQMARVKLNKPEFFRLEIANASMNYRLFEQAIREYLAYLETSPVTLFFTNNQLKTILEEDSTLISVIAGIADSSASAVVKEAYAGALLSRKDYYGALNVYKQLELAKLYRFADDQAASGNDSLAYLAYEYAESLEKDPLKKAELSYRMALISYQRADYAATKALIENNLSLPLWQDRNLAYKSGYAVKIRKLMAETCLAMGSNADSAIVWLEEAKKYARDNTERQETDLEIARLCILKGDVAAATRIIASVKEPALAEKKDYLAFLGALLSNRIALADTLMNDFIIRHPASSYTNDAIYLVMLTLGMQATEQPMFFSAIKLLQMNQVSGIDTLETVFRLNGDEELLLLAIEWSIGLGATERAVEMLNYSFTDPVAAEYTELLKLLMVNDKNEAQRLAREFLKAKPNSIFSPDFRQRISRWSASRPNL